MREKIMSGTTHRLKCGDKYFDALECGTKKAEFRKNDRDFQTCDGLRLECQDRDETLEFMITHIVHGPQYGIPEGYCMLSIEAVDGGGE